LIASPLEPNQSDGVQLQLADRAMRHDIYIGIRFDRFSLWDDGWHGVAPAPTVSDLTIGSGLPPTSESILRRGETVSAFLRAPLNRRCFDLFFSDCLCQTIYCLSSLRARGYRLPVAGETNAASLRDLAYDILGSLLRTERGKKPYHVVIDYFSSRGIGDPRDATTEQLGNLMTGLLWSYARQEIYRLKAQEDPQRAKLKRRLGDVLDDSNYETEPVPGSPVEYVCLTTSRDSLRLNCSILPFERLQRLAESAYLDSCNLSQCCNVIFRELDGMTDVQNRLRRHEVVSAIVAVVSRYLETDGFCAARLSTPVGDFDAGTMNRARKETNDWLAETVICEFVEKGRITREITSRIVLAVDRYLIDLSTHGNTDPIPQYFREVMPECEHGKYLETYKYVFETIISRAVEEFRRRLQD
jgi:hypothetical protein